MPETKILFQILRKKSGPSMTDSVSKVMISIVDSQVKNREKEIPQLSHVETKSNQKYSRSQLIDDKKENILIKSALDLSFQGNEEWTLDGTNPNIQNKQCIDTQRTVFRIVCKNMTMCNFMDVYNYLECGFRGVADFDIIHHIDSDHDILYQKIESPTPEWILSSRDCQCLRMRFYIPEYNDKYSKNTYVVMGTLWYPFDSQWKDHILYIDPAAHKKKCYRITFKYGARVYYKAVNTNNDTYTYIGIQHAYRSGGWIPKFIENAFGLKQKNIKYFEDLCKRIPEELKQREYDINPRVQTPLLHTIAKYDEKNNLNEDVVDDEIDSKEEHNRIKEWLKGDAIDMEQYYDVLVKNGFDSFNLIRTLTIHILQQIGVNKLGHRIELMRRVSSLEGNLDNEVNVEEIEGQHTEYM
eukprot:115890_1